MKKTLMAVAMAATLGLAGCDGWPVGETPQEKIINAIVDTCSWKPDLSSVAAILAALGPEVSITAALVDQIANSVCASVGTAPEEGSFAATEASKDVKIKVGDKEVVVKGNWVK